MQKTIEKSCNKLEKTSQRSLDGQKLRILNFDDSLTCQKNLIAKFTKAPYGCEIIDFKKEAPYLRGWAKRKDLEVLKRKLGTSSANTITLYGSGDFHHISVALTEQFKQPFSAIVFDFHPDWDMLPPQLSCGSWVNAMLDNENVKKIILLGPSSSDLSWRGLLSASFKGIKNKKLEIFPYQREPSYVFFKSFGNPDCFELENYFFSKKIKWKNLAQEPIQSFLEKLLRRVPTDDVYISIDKDCLTKDYALTNWEEGLVPLEWLIAALNIIKNKKNIIGLDITGEYSPIAVQGWIKKIISCFDHPQQIAERIEPSRIASVNEATNLKILELFIK